MGERQHHQVTARVGKTVEDDEGQPPAVDDQVVRAVLLLQRQAKDASFSLLGGFISADIRHAPGRKKVAHGKGAAIVADGLPAYTGHSDFPSEIQQSGKSL